MTHQPPAEDLPVDSGPECVPGKPGLNAFGRRFMEILCDAVDAAAEAKVDRSAIAAALGVSPHTVESWLKPSRASMIPVDRFFELVSREDILPGAARNALWCDLGAEGGYVVVPEVNVGPGCSSPLVHLAQIAVSLGKLAEQIRAATAESSPEGVAISKGEAEAMLAPLRDMEREAVELRLTLEDLIARAGSR